MDIFKNISEVNRSNELNIDTSFTTAKDIEKQKTKSPLKELATTNIPFVASFIYKDFEPVDTKYEKVDLETSQAIFKDFNFIPESEKLDIISNSKNYTDMYNKAKFRNQILSDGQAVADYYGDYAIVANIGASLLNPVDYLYGGILGKGASLAVKGFGVASRTGQRAIEATSAVGTGLASVATLEATTGGSLSKEDTAVVGTVSALLGYGFARKFGTDKSDSIESAIKSQQAEQRVMTGQIDNVELDKYGNKPIVGLNNTPDMNLRYSNNPIEQEIGAKLNHDIQAQTSNLQDTVYDVKSLLNHKITHKAVQDYDMAIKEFETSTGLKYSLDIESEIDSLGGTIDHTLTRAKQKKSKELTEQYKAELEAKIEELKTKLSVDGKKVSKKELTKNDEYKALQDEYKTLVRKQVLEFSKEHIEEILSKVPEKYRKFIDVIRNHNASYAREANRLKLNGNDMLDEAFYWRKDLDINKIKENPELAKQRFKEAIMDNFDESELTDEVIEKINTKADEMIEKLSSDDLKRIDPLDVDREVFLDNLIQTMNVSALKDRKMTYNAGRMTEFMRDGITDRMTNYGKDLSAKLSLKQVFDIDDNFTATQFANSKKLTGKGRDSFNEAIKGVYGMRQFNADSNKTLSRIVDTFQNYNYATLGGWFGVQTLLDLATMVHKYGFGKTANYVISPLLKNIPEGEKERIAHYYGLGVESVLSARSSLMGIEFNPNGRTLVERGGVKFAQLTSKLSGLNMVVDFVDRTTGMLALDFIQSAKITPKVLKKLNVLGLTQDDILKIRNSGAIKYDGKKVTGFDPSMLDDVTRNKLDRGVLRSVNDVILKGDEMNLPEWFTTIMPNYMVKVLFPFMRFPLMAYNKIQRDVYHNFDAVNTSLAVVTATALGSLLAMSKEVGKPEEDKKYGFDTEEKSIETLMFTLDRSPLFASVGTINQYTDVLGQAKALMTGEEYKDKLEGKMFGITLNRLDRFDDLAKNVLSGDLSYYDKTFAKSLVVPNYAWASPINNIFNEEIKKNEQ